MEMKVPCAVCYSAPLESDQNDVSGGGGQLGGLLRRLWVRNLRVSVNSFFEPLVLVTETIRQFG